MSDLVKTNFDKFLQNKTKVYTSEYAFLADLFESLGYKTDRLDHGLSVHRSTVEAMAEILIRRYDADHVVGIGSSVVGGKVVLSKELGEELANCVEVRGKIVWVPVYNTTDHATNARNIITALIWLLPEHKQLGQVEKQLNSAAG